MKQITYTLGLLCLTLISCDEKRSPVTNNNRDSSEKVIIVPYKEDSSIANNRTELFLQNLGRLMGLQAISNGSEGLYLRVWIWESDSNYVVNISKDGHKKECNILLFDSETIDSIENIRISKKWRNLTPLSGWDNFFETINKYQILKMGSDKPAEGRKQFLTHMAYIQFEVARPNEYRFYEYLQPSYYRSIDSRAKNVYDFLEYLDKEMEVNIYNPDEKLIATPK